MQSLTTFAIVILASTVLALPSIVALLRRHPSWLPITGLTVLLGWTIVGWGAALYWAMRRPRARRPKLKRAPKPKTRGRFADPAANDNASLAVPAYGTLDDALLMGAPTADEDAYEEWLERGEAIAAEPARVVPLTTGTSGRAAA